MNIEKAVKEAGCAFDAYKRSDPLMIRKSVSMKDIAYKKNSPEREVWHAELAFDHDFYFAVIVGVAAAAVLACALRRVTCRIHPFCGKKR